MNAPKMESTRKAYGQTLIEMGKEYPSLIVLEADIAKSTHTYMFAEKYPERFINVGVAEQNMMGIAAGLATTGIKPICSTYSVFASMRACEQVRTSICYAGLDVTIVATHGGVATAIDGVSHQAVEDIGIMRGLAGMTVIVPADAVATRHAVRQGYLVPGPCFVRLIRDAVPTIYPDPIPNFQVGKGIVHQEGKDVTIFATGIMVAKALEAAEQLAQAGIQATVVDIHTIKPIDTELIISCARRTGAVVTYEDHQIINGLGSAVAEVLVEECPAPMRRIGLRDVFAESGPREKLYEKYGMSVSHVVQAAKEVVGRKK